MKTIKTLLLLSLSLILFSCSDDDGDDKLAPDSLKQSSWKGEFVQEKDGKVIKKGNIGIEFTTEGSGVFSLIFEDQPNTDYGTPFAYSSDGKLLDINTGAGYNSILYGNWLVISYKKNSLILQKGTSNKGAEKNTITLKRSI